MSAARMVIAAGVVVTMAAACRRERDRYAHEITVDPESAAHDAGTIASAMPPEPSAHIAPAGKVLEATPMDGPHPSLAAYCATFLATCASDCACTPAIASIGTTAAPVLEVATVKTSRLAGSHGMVAPAVRTAAGWFVARTGPELGRDAAAGSQFEYAITVRNVTMSDVIPGGMPELVFEMENPVVATGLLGGGASKTMPAAGRGLALHVLPPATLTIAATDGIDIMRHAGDFTAHQSEVLVGDYELRFP